MSDAADGPVLLGYRKGGQPIYLIQGGAEPPTFTQPPAADPAGDPGSVDDPPPADPAEGDPDPTGGIEPPDLGPAGKQAIERMKTQVKDERTKRKAAEAEAAALKAKATAPPADDVPTTEQLRDAARIEARAEVTRDRALDRVEVLAAKTFANPGDARMFLAANVEEFIDGTSIDSDAIAEALTDLLTARPYLAAGAPRKWTADGDGGPRGGGKKDLETQLADALKAGDVNSYIRLQNQKFPTS